MAQIQTTFTVDGRPLTDGTRVVLTETHRGDKIGRPTPAVITTRPTPAHPEGELGYAFDVSDPARGPWRALSAGFAAEFDVEVTE
jgi:hypothetical protein